MNKAKQSLKIDREAGVCVAESSSPLLSSSFLPSHPFNPSFFPHSFIRLSHLSHNARISRQLALGRTCIRNIRALMGQNAPSIADGLSAAILRLGLGLVFLQEDLEVCGREGRGYVH